MRPGAVRLCSRSMVERGWRVSADKHEAEGDRPVVRQYLQPGQRRHLLRDDRDEGNEFASGRGVRVGQVFLLRQYLEPDRCKARGPHDVQPDLAGAAVVTTKLVP